MKKDKDGYGRDEINPSAYGVIVSTFSLIILSYYLLSRVFQTPLIRDISILQMLLIAVASHKISFLVSKDAVFTFIRAPFSKFDEFIGPGAIVSESPRGKGLRYIVGELLTCPWCLNMWVVVSLVLSYFLFPSFTMAVVFIFVILMMADVFHILYFMLGSLMKKAS